jgi:ParB/RepB/Spo0J family partition protein
VSESPLRRHIDALLADNPGAVSAELQRWLAPTSESQVEQIAVEQIHEREWRGDVDTADAGYRALKASIRASGVLQPLLLRPRPEGGFEVVAGVRRLRAARDTGQSMVPAIVRELGDLAAIVGGAWEALSRSGITMAEARALTARLQAAGMAKAEAVALVATLPRIAIPAGEPPPAQSHRATPTPEGGPDDEDLPAVPVVGRPIGQHPPEAMSVEPAREVVPIEPTAAVEERSTPAAVLERSLDDAAPLDQPAGADASGEALGDADAPPVAAPHESKRPTAAPIVISISTPGDREPEAEAEQSSGSKGPAGPAPESPPVTAPESAAVDEPGTPMWPVPPAPRAPHEWAPPAAGTSHAAGPSSAAAPAPAPPPAPGRSLLQAARQPSAALRAPRHPAASPEAEGLGNPLWYTPYALGIAVGALVFLILSIQQGETGRPLIASVVVMVVALLLAMASLALARRRL